MAEGLDSVVDVMSCDLVGEMKLDIQAVIDADSDLKNMPPLRCSVYHIKSELSLQITLHHNAESDMIEAYLEVLSCVTDTLTFKIKYGMRPFVDFPPNPQIFICTATSKRSENYPITKLNDLIDYMVDNERALGHQRIDFVISIIISYRDTRHLGSKYQIPTVNAKDCDHKITCGGREVLVHRHVLMSASQFFLRRFREHQHLDVTHIDALEISKRIEWDVLTCILRFMYGFNISLHNLRTVNLLRAAREYEVDKLFEICECSMIRELSITLAPELYYIGRTERASALSVAAAKFILANYTAVRNVFEWRAIRDLFPVFWDPIILNTLKHFREIVYPQIRSRSTGDLITRFGVSFLLTTPAIVLTRPITDNTRDERKSPPKADPDTESTSIEGRRGSGDSATLMDCASLDLDMEPVARKRSSPVVSRRHSESASLGAYSMTPLAEALPKPKFSRESLKKRLLANEPKFEETFGPVESSTFSSSVSSLSSSEECERPLVSDAQEDFQLNYNQNIGVPMECSEDSNLGKSQDPSGERPDLPSPSMPPLESPSELAFTYSYSSDSVFLRVPTPAKPMSVSEIPTSQQDRAINPVAMERIDFQMYTHPDARSSSDISSIPLDPSSSVLPESTSSSKSKSRRARRMKKMADKKRRLLPGAASTNQFDLSSTASIEAPIGLIPRPSFSKDKSHKARVKASSNFDQNQSVRKVAPSPVFDSNTTSNASKTSSKKVSAGPKMAPSPVFDSDTTSNASQTASKKFSVSRKMAPSPIFDSDTTSNASETTSKKFSARRKMAPNPIFDSDTTSNSSQTLSKKVSFGETIYIPTYVPLEDEEFDEPEMTEMKYYESWLDTAAHFNIQDVFKEISLPSAQYQGIEFKEEKDEDEKDEDKKDEDEKDKDEDEKDKDEDEKDEDEKDEDKKDEDEKDKDEDEKDKDEDEKDEDESKGEHHEEDNSKHKEPSKERTVEHKKVIKESPTSSSGSAAMQIPMGGGVIRKAPDRFKKAAVDDPVPFSSSESVGTTSSTISSIDETKFKRALAEARSSISDNASKGNTTGAPSTIERTQSYVDLGSVRYSLTPPQMQHNTPVLSGAHSMDGNRSQQRREEPTTQQVNVKAKKFKKRSFSDAKTDDHKSHKP